MAKRNPTTQSLVIRAFLWFFCSSVIVILFIDLGITFYQITTTQPVVANRLHNFIVTNRDLFLNQIVLDRRKSLVDNLNYLQRGRDIDNIYISYKSPSGKMVTLQTKDTKDYSWLVLSTTNTLHFLRILPPLKLTLVSDFGNIKVNVVVNYAKSLTRIFILPLIISAFFLFFLALIPIGVVLFLLFKRFSNVLVIPLQKLTRDLRNNQLPDNIAAPKTTVELKELIEASRYFIDVKVQTANELNLLATQIAHDIRSTLYALQMVCKDLTGLPENKRILIREATNHIAETIRNLEENYQPEIEQKSHIKNTLLMKIIRYCIDEKRAVLASGFNFKTNLDPKTFTIFVNADPQQMRRVLSNILNNAIEASKNNKIIELSTKIESDCIVISVSDQGIGLPKQNAENIFDKGYSTKKGGQGLGLHHAKHHISIWGGSISAKANNKQGVTINIRLPIQPTAEWLSTGFSVLTSMPIVIIDDAKEVHSAWKERLSTSNQRNEELDIISFYSAKRFISWYKHTAPKQAIYLVDYELGDAKYNGLDLIHLIAPNQTVFLVTSHSDDEEIHKVCLTENIKLIPKIYISHVPIKTIEHQPDLIIIEPDNKLVEKYEKLAKENKLSLLSYNSLELFLSDYKLFPGINLYIDDVALTQGDYSRNLSKLSHYNIYITCLFTLNIAKQIEHHNIIDYISKDINFKEIKLAHDK